MKCPASSSTSRCQYLSRIPVLVVGCMIVFHSHRGGGGKKSQLVCGHRPHEPLIHDPKLSTGLETGATILPTANCHPRGTVMRFPPATLSLRKWLPAFC